MRSAIEIMKEKGLKRAEIAYKSGVSISMLDRIPSKYETLDKIAAAIGEPIEVVFDIKRKSPYPKSRA